MPIFSDSRASLQKLTFLDEPIAKTDVPQQLDSWTSGAQQSPSSSLSLSLSLSPLHSMKKKEDIAAYQNKSFESKKFSEDK